MLKKSVSLGCKQVRAATRMPVAVFVVKDAVKVQIQDEASPASEVLSSRRRAWCALLLIHARNLTLNGTVWERIPVVVCTSTARTLVVGEGAAPNLMG